MKEANIHPCGMLSWSTLFMPTPESKNSQNNAQSKNDSCFKSCDCVISFNFYCITVTLKRETWQPYD